MITEEIRKARRAGLGGSDIAGIIPCDTSPTKTLSPWKTQVQVWDSKVGPDTGDSTGNEATWWGNYEESGVATRFSELTGKRTVNHNFMIKDGVLFANVDRLIVPDGQKIAAYHGEIRTNELFEAKTSGEEWVKAEVVAIINGCEILDGATGVKPWCQTQCNHYMGRVPSAERIYVAVKMTIPCGHFCRTEFRIYVLERDDEIIRSQDAYARWWWDRHVVGDVKPEAVCEADAKIIWRRSSPLTSITLTKDVFKAWTDYRDAKDKIDSLETIVATAKLTMQNALQDRESIVAPDGKTILATWKSGKDKTVATTDWEKLARDKGVTDAEIAAATTTVVKPGARTFLPKFTEKVVAATQAIDTAALPTDVLPSAAQTPATEVAA